MAYFISGGCKNKKSIFAQKLAKDIAIADNRKLFYIATMIPKDKEDLSRIKRHLEERKNWGFKTIECGKNIELVFELTEKDDVLLFDSVTAGLENAIFDDNFGIDEKGLKIFQEQMEKLADIRKNTVFVSDNIFCDGIVYDEITEMYRKSLAETDRLIAKRCEKVIEVFFGYVLEIEKTV